MEGMADSEHVLKMSFTATQMCATCFRGMLHLLSS
jgi:hypothetical protein